MEYSIDVWEALIRVVKYAFEGLIVALVALILPKSKLEWGEIWMIALTAACVFSVLDLLAPSVSARCSSRCWSWCWFPYGWIS